MFRKKKIATLLIVTMLEDDKLREMLDAIIRNEVPPYTPVDRWYLFHLVRLPDCDNCWRSSRPS